VNGCGLAAYFPIRRASQPERRPVPNISYWLNFRFEDEEGVERKPKQKARYEALVEVVEEYAMTWWRQSTSLYILDTDIDSDRLAPLFKDCINPECDFFMLGQLGKEEVRIYGRYNDDDIFKLIPYAKKLTRT
jgi:hypothetical protein